MPPDTFDFTKKIDELKRRLESARRREQAFDIWYQKLCDSKPAIARGNVTLTSDNFKKAMKQAFMAGASN